VLQVKVGRIEIAGSLERLPIENCESIPSQDDQTLCSEFLKHSVDVNRREVHRVGELGLRNRQVNGVILRDRAFLINRFPPACERELRIFA
jgi:hypothetical protein